MSDIPVDGRYHWLISCNAFNQRLKERGWEGATDRWIATKFGFNTQDIHNLKTKDHKYRAMDKIAGVFSLGKDGKPQSDELTVYPVIIYLGDQILLPQQLSNPCHQYVANVIDKRVSDLEQELAATLKKDGQTIESHIANRFKDRSLLSKNKITTSAVKRYLNIKTGSPTYILDALATVMGLHLAYYSER